MHLTSQLDVHLKSVETWTSANMKRTICPFISYNRNGLPTWSYTTGNKIFRVVTYRPLVLDMLSTGIPNCDHK